MKNSENIYTGKRATYLGLSGKTHGLSNSGRSVWFEPDNQKISIPALIEDIIFEEPVPKKTWIELAHEGETVAAIKELRHVTAQDGYDQLNLRRAHKIVTDIQKS
ncbi:MAG: hypothetical protein COA52_01310 [Hyphomicrobiales bacterium]|nr:MAG: hypothetical protein COA52_00220 [Hyphomicrobiales bacterium]PCJ96870.1 MAG: hypothetical protein COA52_01310 [Hyphomicrobiales bacterium]